MLGSDTCQLQELTVIVKAVVAALYFHQDRVLEGAIHRVVWVFPAPSLSPGDPVWSGMSIASLEKALVLNIVPGSLPLDNAPCPTHTHTQQLPMSFLNTSGVPMIPHMGKACMYHSS